MGRARWRRSKHKWVLIGVWPVTAAEAGAASDPARVGTSARALTPDGARALFIACDECGILWADAGAICPGEGES